MDLLSGGRLGANGKYSPGSSADVVFNSTRYDKAGRPFMTMNPQIGRSSGTLDYFSIIGPNTQIKF